ncbi:tyrosine-type recombinase/integrase [Arthrobacter sp. TMN-37]
MAIKKLPNGKYQHDYRIDGRRIFKRFPTLAAARANELSVANAKAGGTLVDTRKGEKLRFHDLYEEWLARIGSVGADGKRPASPVTVAGYRRIYLNHIRDHFEYRPLGAITLGVVNSWLGTFRTDDARQRAYRQLGRMLQYAVDSGYIANNVARNARMNHVAKPEPVREARALTANQLKTLATECSLGGRVEEVSHAHYKLLVLFAGTTGLRWSEIAGLQARSVHLGENSYVLVESALVPVDGRLELRSTTKGRRPRRVPIPDSVASLLRAHIEGMDPGALVFTAPSGRELRSSNFARRILHPAVNRCRERDPAFPRIVFHDLRRTAVSLAISADANVKVVQQIAGHRSAVTTLDTYAQYYEDDLHASARAVDRMFSPGAGELI